MDIVCDKCQGRFRIPDEKIPKDKLSSIPCPKCKNKIAIDTREKEAAVEKDETYDASEKPFDFVEEEGKTALICEVDAEIKKKIIKNITEMEYHITGSESIRDAMKKMRYHVYDLILINEDFDTDDPDTNGILTYLERVEMETRRNIFVVLISNRFRTLDNMIAFNKSVNIVVNTKNIDDLEKILNRAITENNLFYRVYKETLKNLGRI